MGLLNLFKSKATKYEEQVGKMDDIRVQKLLDLMSPEMKKMLLSQVSGINYNPPKEQQERMAKLLDEAQKMPMTDKLELLTMKNSDLDLLAKNKEKVEACSYLQSKWKEMEEHYGKKISENVPASIKVAFYTLGTDFTHSDVVKGAEQSDNVALMGALAYTLLLDAHKKGRTDVETFCGIKAEVDNRMGNRNDRVYPTVLKGLDKERERNEKQQAAKNARIAATLGR